MPAATGGLAGKRRGGQEQHWLYWQSRSSTGAISRDNTIAELRAALSSPSTRTLVPLARNRTALINLPTTIAALETVDRLITYYRDCRPEAIEVRFERGSSSDVIQLDRDMALELLTHKRQSLVDYLASLGIAA